MDRDQLIERIAHPEPGHRRRWLVWLDTAPDWVFMSGLWVLMMWLTIACLFGLIMFQYKLEEWLI